MAVTLEQARAAKAMLLERLRDRHEVVGVGITRVNEDYAVKVNLAMPMVDCDLPPLVDGVPIRVEVTGSIRPLNE